MEECLYRMSEALDPSKKGGGGGRKEEDDAMWTSLLGWYLRGDLYPVPRDAKGWLYRGHKDKEKNLADFRPSSLHGHLGFSFVLKT